MKKKTALIDVIFAGYNMSASHSAYCSHLRDLETRLSTNIMDCQVAILGNQGILELKNRPRTPCPIEWLWPAEKALELAGNTGCRGTNLVDRSNAAYSRPRQHCKPSQWDNPFTAPLRGGGFNGTIAMS